MGIVRIKSNMSSKMFAKKWLKAGKEVGVKTTKIEVLKSPNPKFKRQFRVTTK